MGHEAVNEDAINQPYSNLPHTASQPITTRFLERTSPLSPRS